MQEYCIWLFHVNRDVLCSCSPPPPVLCQYTLRYKTVEFWFQISCIVNTTVAGCKSRLYCNWGIGDWSKPLWTVRLSCSASRQIIRRKFCIISFLFGHSSHPTFSVFVQFLNLKRQSLSLVPYCVTLNEIKPLSLVAFIFFTCTYFVEYCWIITNTDVEAHIYLEKKERLWWRSSDDVKIYLRWIYWEVLE